jgi:hypothetical protein
MRTRLGPCRVLRHNPYNAGALCRAYDNIRLEQCVRVCVCVCVCVYVCVADLLMTPFANSTHGLQCAIWATGTAQ